MQSTGEKIKKIRIHLGLNQEDFGKLFGVGKAYISSVEKNNSRFSYGNLVYLLVNHKINLNWLLDDSNGNDSQMLVDTRTDDEILEQEGKGEIYATKDELNELKQQLAELKKG